MKIATCLLTLALASSPLQAIDPKAKLSFQQGGEAEEALGTTKDAAKIADPLAWRLVRLENLVLGTVMIVGLGLAYTRGR